MSQVTGHKSFRVAVLASTRGTDLQAIIDEMKAEKMPGIELAIVVSNKKDCYALQRAREQGYKTLFIDPNAAPQKHEASANSHMAAVRPSEENFDAQLITALDAEKIDLVVLVGYMRILSPEFVRHFKNRIINIHPALLPKFGGKNFYGKSVHEAVLAAGEKETGMTIHYVDEGVDTGAILLQKKIPIDPHDTAETLKEKVQNLEKKYYPEVIRQLAHTFQS